MIARVEPAHCISGAVHGRAHLQRAGQLVQEAVASGLGCRVSE